MKNTDKAIKEHYQKLGRLSHKKSPRNKEFYQAMQRRAVEVRRAKKWLSPD